MKQLLNILITNNIILRRRKYNSTLITIYRNISMYIDMDVER